MKHLYRTTRETLVERISLADSPKPGAPAKPSARRAIPRAKAEPAPAPIRVPKPTGFEKTLTDVVLSDAHSIGHHECGNGDTLVVARLSPRAAAVMLAVMSALAAE